MREHLQIARMLTASAVVATFFSLYTPTLRADASDNGSSTPITTTDDHGRKIYVNEDGPPTARRHAQPTEPAKRPLMYWSVKDNRWKPVPSANAGVMQAARSAAAEVTRYFGHDSYRSANAKIINANFRGRSASPEDIDAAITMAAARHNVDPNLVRAVVKVESNYNPNAVSRKGAMGLMQLMPSTARELRVKNPFDPQQNVDAGVRHLKQLLESYGGDVNLTLAAYNAGSGAVNRSAGVPHIAETRSYVRRITDLYYGGFNIGPSGGYSLDPVHVQRDARGVLYISNTD